MSKETELTRRKILGGIAGIGVASAAAGAGTMALFNDTEQSGTNTVSAGTLDLGSTSTAGFTVSDAAPGDTGLGGTVSADYTGSINGVEVDVSSATLSDETKTESGEYTTNASKTEFAKQLTLTTAEAKVNGTTETDILSNLSDGNGNSRVDLADFVDNAPYDDAFGDVTNSDTVQLELKMTMNSGAGNKYQNDGVGLQVTLRAEQTNDD